MVKFAESGQGYIDFDSLEFMTSKEFVEEVQSYVEVNDNVVVENYKYNVDVFVKKGVLVRVFRFHKDRPDNIQSMVFSLLQMEVMNDLFGGVN